MSECDCTTGHIAMAALLQAKAVAVCEFHSDVVIRLGDQDAERHAYALGTLALKREGSMALREDLVATIDEILTQASDGECAPCSFHRDD